MDASYAQCTLATSVFESGAKPPVPMYDANKETYVATRLPQGKTVMLS